MVGDILQPTHLLFVLVVALLVLGPKRLPEVGRTLGSGIRDFRQAISGDSPNTSHFDWTHQMAESAQPEGEQRHQPSFEPDADGAGAPSAAAPVSTAVVDRPVTPATANEPSPAAPISARPAPAAVPRMAPAARPAQRVATAARPAQSGSGASQRIPRPGESVQRPTRPAQRSSS